jgi:hemoglobin
METEPAITPLPDITGRADIVVLVDRFYDRVRKDDRLGFVFDQVAQVDWALHLPKLYDFWDTVLFRANTFRGNLIGAHAQWIAAAGMDRELFDHWLVLFRRTVAENFSGPNAGHIVRCAEDMASVIHGKIHRLPDPRLDPSRLTSEQQARYASFQKE